MDLKIGGLIAIGILCGGFLLGKSVSAQNITNVYPSGCSQLMNLPNGGRLVYGQVNVIITDWHDLLDTNKLTNVLNRGREAGYAACVRQAPPTMAVFVSAVNSSGSIYVAAWDRNPGQWRITENLLPRLQQFEVQRAAAAAASKAEEERAAAAARAKEQVKLTALANCGATPNISGGPWFSSTYKTAAIDSSRNESFLCVKTVEYIGAAVNLFGGNAARARFTGYDRVSYEPLSIVMDFPY
jgi:hypothetical protein